MIRQLAIDTPGVESLPRLKAVRLLGGERPARRPVARLVWTTVERLGLSRRLLGERSLSLV